MNKTTAQLENSFFKKKKNDKLDPRRRSFFRTCLSGIEKFNIRIISATANLNFADKSISSNVTIDAIRSIGQSIDASS